MIWRPKSLHLKSKGGGGLKVDTASWKHNWLHESLVPSQKGWACCSFSWCYLWLQLRTLCQYLVFGCKHAYNLKRDPFDPLGDPFKKCQQYLSNVFDGYSDSLSSCLVPALQKAPQPLAAMDALHSHCPSSSTPPMNSLKKMVSHNMSTTSIAGAALMVSLITNSWNYVLVEYSSTEHGN